ncbi:carbohydrate ABC transporter membrane protein 1, CUT1 family [Kytococcus aerolatus]|uniref:Carbohydrate ABC transporter membrane protein 1, CUT1 family n=1 Tax=Kytococcus aerolatus TaxID=592308 RepID=A0A212T9C9_9MICO|nr:sugar ABC transporter permease [Kytococcus aerolatus]SNC62622.1 carbohydrate ABC transporter membrane protein 1, CUT1 family [Kytococcus aerolatus]
MSTAVDDTPQQSRRKAPLSDRARSERNLGWLLSGPAFLVMLAVTLFPILYALWNSLFQFRLTDPEGRRFVGLQNYATALGDELWWKATGVTAVITLITVVVELVLGFLIALLMHRVVLPRKTLRTIVLIPYSIVTVVSAYAWLYAFRVDTGFVNYWMNTLTFGAFGEGFNWFGSFWPAVFVISLSEIWKTTPFMSLLLLAGLAQIDGAMEEAAAVDGAGFWQRLWKVVIPNMKAAVMVALLFRTLDAFRIFDNPFIMTGGANETSTLSMVVYRQTIERMDIGLGSALSVLLFAYVVLIALVFVKGFKVDLTEGK